MYIFKRIISLIISAAFMMPSVSLTAFANTDDGLNEKQTTTITIVTDSDFSEEPALYCVLDENGEPADGVDADSAGLKRDELTSRDAAEKLKNAVNENTKITPDKDADSSAGDDSEKDHKEFCFTVLPGTYLVLAS